MKITSGAYEIFESGSVISYEHSAITFHLAVDLLATFSFHQDTEETRPRIVFDRLGPSEGGFKLINFHSSSGAGTSSPIRLGVLNNRGLYLSLKVYTIANEDANILMHYTFYLGEEVNNG